MPITILQSVIDGFRPPLSYKVRDYFAGLLNEESRKEKGAFVNKGNIIISIKFLEKSDRVKFDKFFVLKTPDIVQGSDAKIYSILIVSDLFLGIPDPYTKIIEVLVEALCEFLNVVFPKLKREAILLVKEKIDWQYLLTLPYPATFLEQKYLHDEENYVLNSDGTIRERTLSEKAAIAGYKGLL